MMQEQLRLKIFGKVQGVTFRANTKRRADELGLRGWVRNNSEGTVTIVAQGEKEDLEELLEWARGGPSLARVKMVEKHWEEIEQKFDDFSVQY